MSAYQAGYVVSIIGPNGKPYREYHENGVRTCVVPFGTEYKIRLKNQDRMLRTKVKVSIDGMDVCTQDRAFILEKGQTLDLERFVDDLGSGKAFKFISKTEGEVTGMLQDPNSATLGEIKVEFYKETPMIFISSQGASHHWSCSCCSSSPFLRKSLFDYDGALSRGGITSDIFGSAVNCSTGGLEAASYTSTQVNLNNTAGGTAEGSSNFQKFTTGADFTANSIPDATIVIKLRGPAVVDDTPSYTIDLKYRNGFFYIGDRKITENDFSVHDNSIYLAGLKLPIIED